MASVRSVQGVRRAGRYLEASRVFAAVTFGRFSRSVEALAHEAEQASGRLPQLAGGIVAGGISTSGSLLRRGGQRIQDAAEHLETFRLGHDSHSPR